MQVGKILGSGRYGKIYEYENHALKHCFRKKGEQFVSSACLREINGLIVLKGHPNIISMEKIYCGTLKLNDCNQDMSEEVLHPLLERGSCSLMTYMLENDCSEEQKLSFLVDILLGLEYMHSMGLVHCDIKPHNIIVVNGVAKIADFGLCQYVLPGQMKDMVTSSPNYCAPEIFQRRDYTEKIDVWSWACLAYQIMTKDHLIDLRGKKDTSSIVVNLLSSSVKLNRVSNVELRHILTDCLSMDRPSISEILDSSCWEFARDRIQQTRREWEFSPSFEMKKLPSEYRQTFRQAVFGVDSRVACHTYDILQVWLENDPLTDEEKIEDRIALCILFVEKLLFGISKFQFHTPETCSESAQRRLLESCSYQIYRPTCFEQDPSSDWVSFLCSED
jgi:serine/threonine protein kinase